MMRYPGGKAKIKRLIADRISYFYELNGYDIEFASPFFGAGGMEFHLLGITPIESIWINDFDPGIAAIWTAVMLYPKELGKKIKAFVPSVAKFELFKKELLSGKTN